MTRHLVRDLIARGTLRVEDGNHGNDRPRPDEFVAEGTAYIRAADMTSGVVDFAGAGKINDVAVRRIRKGIGAPGDVILSHKGTVGRVAVAPLDSPDFVCSPQTTIWRSLDNDVIDPRFLAYSLRSDVFQRQLAALAGKTDMAPYASLTDQRSMTIDLPPIDSQRGVGDVLGALDDKIIVNRNVASCSVKLAETLFRQASLTAREQAVLGNVATVVLGGTPSRDRAEYWTNGTVPWIASGKANEERVLRPSEWITSEALAKSAAKLMPRGATILAITGATLGQVARLEIEASGNQSLVGIWHESAALNDWIYFAIREGIGELLKHATGAAQQHVNKATVEALRIPLPPSDGAFQRWSEVVRPLLDAAAAADRESLRLAAARDELLPLLMSGKVRVRDAERVVEGVA